MSSLRGYVQIQRIVSRIKARAEISRQQRRTCSTLHIDSHEYNLIRRWPEAAKKLEIEMSAEVITWRSFKLLSDE